MLLHRAYPPVLLVLLALMPFKGLSAVVFVAWVLFLVKQQQPAPAALLGSMLPHKVSLFAPLVQLGTIHLRVLRDVMFVVRVLYLVKQQQLAPAALLGCMLLLRVYRFVLLVQLAPMLPHKVSLFAPLVQLGTIHPRVLQDVMFVVRVLYLVKQQQLAPAALLGCMLLLMVYPFALLVQLACMLPLKGLVAVVFVVWEPFLVPGVLFVHLVHLGHTHPPTAYLFAPLVLLACMLPLKDLAAVVFVVWVLFLIQEVLFVHLV